MKLKYIDKYGTDRTIHELELKEEWVLNDILEHLANLHKVDLCNIIKSVYLPDKESIVNYSGKETLPETHILNFLDDPEVKLSIKDLSLDSQKDKILEHIYVVELLTQRINCYKADTILKPTSISDEKWYYKWDSGDYEPSFRLGPQTDDWDDWD